MLGTETVPTLDTATQPQIFFFFFFFLVGCLQWLYAHCLADSFDRRFRALTLAAVLSETQVRLQ